MTNNRKSTDRKTAGLPERELGFGSRTTQGTRLINPDGSTNIVRLNAPKFQAVNIYHELISMGWLAFIAATVLAYVGINLIFAGVYELVGIEHLAGIVARTNLEKFLEAFFFSTQTFTTVGYGRINPMGFTVNIVAALESLTGLLFFALVTGLLYGRFSRPNAKFIYSKNALIAPYHNSASQTALMFRFANARKNQLIEVEVQIVLAYDKTQENGETKRSFVLLPLEISKINFLTMSWTVVHPINEDSLLYQKNEADLAHLNPEFLILIKGIDDTYSQAVYDRTSYTDHELVWNAKYVPIIGKNAKQKSTIDLGKIDAFERI